MDTLSGNEEEGEVCLSIMYTAVQYYCSNINVFLFAIFLRCLVNWKMKLSR